MAQTQHELNPIVLFNGLELNDQPPGYSITRYHQFKAGAWISARILVYCYSSFPPLWAHSSPLSFALTSASTSASASGPSEASSYRSQANDPNNPSFAYKWHSWVEKLEAMDKQVGSWAVLAERLSQTDTNHELVQEVAKAVIELTVRDAEIERNSYREQPVPIPPFTVAQNALQTTSGTNTHEQAFMARIRSATGYEPRVRRVEKCIYRALAFKNTLLVHAIAANAPQNSSVHQVIQEGSF